MATKVGICFSKSFEGNDPLCRIGRKLPVYIRFLELCQHRRWQTFVLTRKTYKGKGIFAGSWLFNKGHFQPVRKIIKIDLVYDRVGGLKFPPLNDPEMIVVNRLDFKELCWDKWLVYQEIGDYMPKTFWVGEKENLTSVLSKVKTEWIVLKPYNGLKGLGVFIGLKSKAMGFEFLPQYPKYIAQEFIDTSGGIPGIVRRLHDLRVVIINGEPVWCHVRIPLKGSFKAVARGGRLREVDYRLVPDAVKKIVNRVAKDFYQRYDNPVFSLDFGLDKKGKPFIFELNDQIGFPRWEMEARDIFLKELIDNFEGKLKRRKK